VLAATVQVHQAGWATGQIVRHTCVGHARGGGASTEGVSQWTTSLALWNAGFQTTAVGVPVWAAEAKGLGGCLISAAMLTREAPFHRATVKARAT